MHLRWDSYRVLHQPRRHSVGSLGQQIDTSSTPCSCHILQSTESCIVRMLHSQLTCEDATASPGAGSQSEEEPSNAP